MADVLIADDEIEFTNLLSSYLTDAGHDVRVVNEGLRVMAEVNTKQPDVILLDMRMPAGNGAHILETLHSKHEWARIPVVVMTGLTEQAAERMGYKHDAHAFLNKPFPMKDVLTLIQDLTDAASVRVIPD